MKKSIVSIVLLLSLVLMFTACGQSQETAAKETTTAKKTTVEQSTTKEATTKEAATKQSTTEKVTTSEEESESEFVAISDWEWDKDGYEQLIDYILANETAESYENSTFSLTYDVYGDFDNDGKIEVVLVAKVEEIENDYIVFYLRLNDEVTDNMADNYQMISAYGGLSFGEELSAINLVPLRKAENYVLNVEFTYPEDNGENNGGLALYEFKTDELALLYTSYNYDEDGKAWLVDNDEDGFYDGLVDYMEGYTVYHYPTTINHIFKEDNTLYCTDIVVDVDMSQSEQTAEDVLLEYFYLVTLREGLGYAVNVETKMTELDQKIEQINPNATIKSYWGYEILENMARGLEPQLQFSAEYDNDIAVITVKSTDQFDAREVVYTMMRVDNHWQIVSEVEAYANSNTNNNVVLNDDSYVPLFAVSLNDEQYYELEHIWQDDNNEVLKQNAMISMVTELVFQNEKAIGYHFYPKGDLPEDVDAKRINWYFVEQDEKLYLADEANFNSYVATGELTGDMIVIAGRAYQNNIVTSDGVENEIYVSQDEDIYYANIDNRVEDFYSRSFKIRRDEFRTETEVESVGFGLNLSTYSAIHLDGRQDDIYLYSVD